MRKCLSCVGLTFNLVAALLLFFALQVKSASKKGDTYQPPAAEGEKFALIAFECPRLIPVGLAFLFTGFVIQLGAEFFPEEFKKVPPLKI
jgi:hypothetical protein